MMNDMGIIDWMDGVVVVDDANSWGVVVIHMNHSWMIPIRTMINMHHRWVTIAVIASIAMMHCNTRMVCMVYDSSVCVKLDGINYTK